MSAVARQWLGGQMAHAAALTALVAPTVNCAKRYKVNSMAPTNVTWGVENRSAAFRIKDLGRENVHIENRIPCGSANPYLIMAGMVAAGMDGLKRELEPPAETTGVAWGREGVADLPTSLEQSLQAFEADGVLRDALGEELVRLFLAVKRHEIAKAKSGHPRLRRARLRGYRLRVGAERVLRVPLARCGRATLSGRSLDLPQARLRPAQPGRHAHLVVHRARGDEVLDRLRALADPPVEGAETEMAVGGDRTHTEPVGEGHGLAIAGHRPRNVRRVPMRGDLGEHPQACGLEALLTLAPTQLESLAASALRFPDVSHPEPRLGEQRPGCDGGTRRT